MISNSIIFGCEGTYLTKEERFFFKDANPWAFILFSRNLDSPNQIKTLCNDLRDCVGSNVPILIKCRRLKMKNNMKQCFYGID